MIAYETFSSKVVFALEWEWSVCEHFTQLTYIKELDQGTSEVNFQLQNAKCQPEFDLYINIIQLV